MKTAVVVVVVCLAAVACATRSNPLFRNWAEAHGKLYTGAEYVRRQAIFEHNLVRIEAMNRQGHALFAPTVFADLTQEEFEARLLTTAPAKPEDVKRVAYVPAHRANDLPESWDWRNQAGVVGKVKDQASCGSCWAFSTIGYLESQAVLKQKLAHIELSEQQILDCDSNCLDTPAPDGHPCDLGCNGGWPTTALKYIVANASMTEKDYPYKGRNQNCKYDAKKIAVKFTGTPSSLEIGAESSIKDLLYTEGPLSISLDASTWSFYSGGIYHSTSCSTAWKSIDHSVVLVGWGHDKSSGKDYWIVRNSWGGSWGESGHIRLLMGDNECGIANMVVWLKQ